jgi:hypothetical protein
VLVVAGCGNGSGSDVAPPSGSGATPGAPPSPSAASSTVVGDSTAPTASSTPTTPTTPTTPSPSLPEITPEGTALDFGEAAVVRHRAGRRGTTLLSLTVRSARQGRLSDLSGFDLSDPYARNASYYYVRVHVENVGLNRVGPFEVPLRGISDANTLLPPVRLTADFPPCRTRPVPRGFGPGSTLDTCLVFLSPDRGALVGVSYRPTTDDDPIVWTGEVAPPGPKPRPSTGTRTPDGGGAGS